MTEQEQINTQSRVSNLETKFEMFMRLQDERFNSFIQEMRDFKIEMRQQNEMRANEIRDLQKKHDEEQAKREAAQAKHEADMREINKKIDDKFDKISSQLQMMSVTTIFGVGAIVWAIVSALK